MKDVKNVLSGMGADINDAGKKIVDTLAETSKAMINDSRTVTKNATRMGKNGLHSVEDALIEGVALAQKGAIAAKETTKQIVDHPEILLDGAKNIAIKSKGLSIKAIDSTKDVFDRRDELKREFIKSTKKTGVELATTIKDATQYTIENPLEAAEGVLGFATEQIAAARRGAAHAMRDLSGHLQVGRDDLRIYIERLALQSQEHFDLTKTPLPPFAVTTSSDANAFLDALLVGADSMHAALAREVPTEVLKAYADRWPALAAEHSFRELVSERILKGEDLNWIVSGLKGRIFEVRHVDYLNDGNLPDGYTAFLAESQTQTGWDAYIEGQDSEVTQLLQLKASLDLSYMKEALQQYPGIPIVVPTETHADLAMRGFHENFIDSPIKLRDLENLSQHGIDAAQTEFRGPSVIALALIAFTEYTRGDINIYLKTENTAERLTGYGMSYGAASLVANFDYTGATFVALLVSSVTRAVIASGGRKFERIESLHELVQNNEKLLVQLRERRQLSIGFSSV